MAKLVRPRLLSAVADRCIFCQFRRLHVSARRLEQAPQPESPSPRPTKPQPPLNRPHIRARDGELVPKPLSRPLGLPYPPQTGQNTGKDTRTLRQRRDDFTSYDKHIERRQMLMKDLYEKNYFRDIGNLGRIHKGKSIIAPTTPFRSNLALYFPNLQGKTLARGAPKAVDTTPVLQGKVSVVSLLNTEWGKEQCESFVGAQTNPALHEYLRSEGAKGFAQQVEINIEENWLKNYLIRMFMGRLRKKYPEEMHDKYFLVDKGLDDNIREALSVWNIKVGYVFLLDGHCRIRWAGNGPAREDEKTSLVNCLKRLVDEAKGVQRMKVSRQDARPTKPQEEVPPVLAVAA